MGKSNRWTGNWPLSIESVGVRVGVVVGVVVGVIVNVVVGVVVIVSISIGVVDGVMVGVICFFGVIVLNGVIYSASVAVIAGVIVTGKNPLAMYHRLFPRHRQHRVNLRVILMAIASVSVIRSLVTRT